MLSAAPASEPKGPPPPLHQTQENSTSNLLNPTPLQSSSSSAPSLLQAGGSVQPGSSPTSPLTSPYSDARQSAHPPSGMSASPILNSSHETAEVPLSPLPAASPPSALSGDSTVSEPGPVFDTAQLDGSSGIADPLMSSCQDNMFTCQSEPPTISEPQRLGRQESRQEKVDRMRVIISVTGILDVVASTLVWLGTLMPGHIELQDCEMQALAFSAGF